MRRLLSLLCLLGVLWTPAAALTPAQRAILFTPRHTTLNPNDIAPAATLSSDLLTITQSGAASWAGARATNPIPPGAKIVFEISIVNAGGNNAFGIGNPSASITNYFGVDSNSVACVTCGNILFNNASIGVGVTGTPANGDIFDEAIDLLNNQIWMRKNGGVWNNSGTANPSTNTGGYSISSLVAGPRYPGVIFISGGVARMNFGATPFAFAMPAGFSTLP